MLRSLWLVTHHWLIHFLWFHVLEITKLLALLCLFNLLLLFGLWKWSFILLNMLCFLVSEDMLYIYWLLFDTFSFGIIKKIIIIDKVRLSLIIRSSFFSSIITDHGVVNFRRFDVIKLIKVLLLLISLLKLFSWIILLWFEMLWLIILMSMLLVFGLRMGALVMMSEIFRKEVLELSLMDLILLYFSFNYLTCLWLVAHHRLIHFLRFHISKLL